nr:cysteine synthase 2 [Quercus suber]
MQALETGKLAQGGVVTEESAGNTAISLATVAPAYGCKCHVVIPDDAAIEKFALLWIQVDAMQLYVVLLNSL